MVVIGTAESTRLFLRGLKLCIQKYGRMSTIYMDHGPGFDSNATREVVASLDDVHLVLGEVGYPQGRGKVERFNQTIDQDVLRKLDKNPDCDPDLGSLEIRLQHYIDQVYGERPHRGLGQLTPNQRFHEDTRALRFVEDSSAFDDAFVVKHRRRVSHDHVISLGGESYEVPRGYAGHKIVVIRQILEDAAVLFDHDGKRIQLHPVDRVRNAHGKRAKPNIKLADNRRASPGDSAAGARFVRDHAPLVDGDGGYRSTDVGLDDLDPSGDDPGDPTDHDDIPF